MMNQTMTKDQKCFFNLAISSAKPMHFYCSRALQLSDCWLLGIQHCVAVAFSEAEVRYEGSRFFVLTTAQDGFNLTWLPSLHLGLRTMKHQTWEQDLLWVRCRNHPIIPNFWSNSLGFCSELCSVVICLVLIGACCRGNMVTSHLGFLGSGGSLIPETCLIFLGPKDDPSWVQVALLPFGSETCLEMKFSWDRWMQAGCNLRIWGKKKSVSTKNMLSHCFRSSPNTRRLTERGHWSLGKSQNADATFILDFRGHDWKPATVREYILYSYQYWQHLCSS